LVSEAFQYGGTPDTIALIDGGLGLIDFKTSAKPYPDHLVALAAHGRLWEENHPQDPLSSYHLICLPKDGSAFRHHAYADLSLQLRLFTLWLDAYRLEKGCTIAKAKAAAKPKPAEAKAEMPRPRRPACKSTAAEVANFLAAAVSAPKPMPVIEQPAVLIEQRPLNDGDPARLRPHQGSCPMLIEIAETHSPQFGKKVATVIAKGGDKFEIWPEKLADIQVGGKYEVDVAERDYNGRTIKKITKATPVNGAAKPATNGSAVHTDGEPQFVATVLAALIAAGEVKNDKKQLFDATNMLRGLWGATLGGGR
jgi:hypothetical protein